MSVYFYCDELIAIEITLLGNYEITTEFGAKRSLSVAWKHLTAEKGDHDHLEEIELVLF